NLPYLQLCVEGIRQHSAVAHQIILHINEGADGTKAWAVANGIEFTESTINIGICRAVNLAAQLVRHDYIVYMNDDMYPLPGWDKFLMNEIQELDTDCFLLSATMIEPVDTKNR